MEKRTLKILTFFAITCLSVSMLFGCGKSVNLVNFTDQTKSIGLGGIYKITDLTVADESGNEYFCDVTVKDSQGQKVVVINNEFEVTDLNGYTINYTVDVNGKTLEKTVTLNVEDSTAPEITVGNAKTGFVNQTYVLPTFTASDASGCTVTTSAKLYRVDGKTKTAVTYENNSFTPTSIGTYNYEITATDIIGNTATKTAAFAIREDVPENVLENFDDPSSVLNCTNYGVEYVQRIAGATGVIKIPASDADKTGVFIKFLKDKSAYIHTPFDKVTVKVLTSRNAAAYYTTSEGTFENWTQLYEGKWADYEITEFVDWDYFFNQATDSVDGAQLFWLWTKDVDIYIDEITFTATPDIDFSVSAESVNEGDDVNVSANVIGDDRLSAEITVTSPSGKDVLISNGKFTAEETGEYVVNAVVNSIEYPWYNGQRQKTITCYGKYLKAGKAGDKPEISNVGKTYVIAYSTNIVETVVTIPEGTLCDYETDEVIVSGIKPKIYYHGDEMVMDGWNFTPLCAGTFNLVYTVTEGGKTYTANADLAIADKPETDMDYATFRTAESAKLCKATEVEWLSEFEGRTGVIRLNAKVDNWASHYIYSENLTKEKLLSDDWDAIEIDMYTPDGSGWLYYGNDGEKSATNRSLSDYRGRWFTIKISRDKLTEYGTAEQFADTVLDENNGLLLLVGYGNGGNIYIDSIRLTKTVKPMN